MYSFLVDEYLKGLVVGFTTADIAELWIGIEIIFAPGISSAPRKPK